MAPPGSHDARPRGSIPAGRDIACRIITFRKASAAPVGLPLVANRPRCRRDHLFKIGNESSSRGDVVIAHVFLR